MKRRLLYCLIVCILSVNAGQKVGQYFDLERYGIDSDTLKQVELVRSESILIADERIVVGDEINDNIPVFVIMEIKDGILENGKIYELEESYFGEVQRAVFGYYPYRPLRGFMKIFFIINKSENTVLIKDFFIENIEGEYIFNLLKHKMYGIAKYINSVAPSIEEVLVDDAIIQDNNEAIDKLVDKFKKSLLAIQGIELLEIKEAGD